MPKEATGKEIYDLVDQATDLVNEHPPSTQAVFWELTEPILDWYGESSTGKRSRSQSRKRVSFAPEQEADTERDYISEPWKASGFETRDDYKAARLVALRQVKKDYPDWELLSTEQQRDLLAEHGLDEIL